MLRQLIFIIILSIPTLAQNADSLQIYINGLNDSLSDIKRDIESVGEKNPLCIISAKIVFEEGEYLLLYGDAIPRISRTDNQSDFSERNPGYIHNGYLVISKKLLAYRGESNYGQGLLNYLYDGTLKNENGDFIFVKYYGDQPKYIEEKLEQLHSKKNTIQSRIDASTNQLIEIKIQNVSNNADKKIKEKNFKAAISLLKEGLRLAPNNSNILSKLSNTYNLLIEENSINNDFLSSLNVIKDALLIKEFTENIRKDFEESFFSLSYQLASDFFNKEQYTEAIGYFRQCTTYDRHKKESVSTNLAMCFSKIADTELQEGLVEQAITNYEIAISYDNVLTKEIKQKLSKLKKDSLLFGGYSIIPGLGQLLQAHVNEGLVHFAIFSASMIGGKVFMESADHKYSEYLKADSETKAVDLYTASASLLNYARVFYAIGGATAVYSIINSFVISEKYNDKFILKLSNKTPNNYNDFSLSLQFYF